MTIKAFRAFPARDRILLCMGYLVDEVAPAMFCSDDSLKVQAQELSAMLKNTDTATKKLLLLSLLEDAMKDSKRG